MAYKETNKNAEDVVLLILDHDVDLWEKFTQDERRK